MHDLHEHEMAELFTKFREEALRDVRPAESGQIRAASHRRRQVRTVTVAAVTVVALAVSVAVWAAVRPGPVEPPVGNLPSPAARVTPGPGDLTIDDLNGRALALPAWPNLVVQHAKPCPHDDVTFVDRVARADGRSPAELTRWIHADVDRDSRPDLVVQISCYPDYIEGFKKSDVEQLVAFARAPGASVRVLGQVVATSADIGGIAGLGAGADGTVMVEVLDFGSPFEHMAQRQTRNYAFDGAQFRQAGGPTVFPPNAAVTDLGVSVAPLVFGPARGGTRTGTLTVEIRNLGSASMPVLVELQLPEALAVDATCDRMMPDDNPLSNIFRCYRAPIAAGATATAVFEVTAPASYRGDETLRLVDVAPQTSEGLEYPDLNLANNGVEIPITVS